MHSIIKKFMSIGLLLSIAVSASVKAAKESSSNIDYAPAIDVPYSEVIENVKEHIGVNVRWGGRVIASEKVGDKIQLTIIAQRLINHGKPAPSTSKEFKGGRFIVEVDGYKRSKKHRYLTVYGEITGEKTLVNGNKSKVIPVITAAETKKWKSNLAYRDKRGNAYYSLGYRAGHFNRGYFRHRHYGHRYFGHRSYGYRKFGHRGFGHRGFGRRGY